MANAFGDFRIVGVAEDSLPAFSHGLDVSQGWAPILLSPWQESSNNPILKILGLLPVEIKSFLLQLVLHEGQVQIVLEPIDLGTQILFQPLQGPADFQPPLWIE